MATACKLVRGTLIKNCKYTIRYLSNANRKQLPKESRFLSTYVIGGAIAVYAAYKCHNPQRVHTIQAKTVSVKYLNLTIIANHYVINDNKMYHHLKNIQV